MNVQQRCRSNRNVLIDRARMLALARLPPDTNRHEIVRIIDIVARIHHSKLAELTGRLRHVYIIRARYHAIYILRRLRPGFSFSQIGRYLNRDRGTIEYALRVFDKRVRPCIGSQMEAAERILGKGSE